MKFRGKIENGKLRLQARTAMIGWVSAQPDGPVVVEIRKPKHIRTNAQRRYYFGVVCKYLGNHLGYTVEEMHEAIKWQFLKKPGSNPLTVKSTTKMDTAEFTEFVESVVRWAAIDFQVVIPDPE